jgi:hypothetical protein
MPIRHYFSQLAGDGLTPDTAWKPIILTLVPGIKVNIYEGRVNPAIAAGWSLVEAEVTNAEHNIIRADIRVLPLPFEEAGTGRILGMDESVDLLAQIDRDRIMNRCEQVGVYMNDIAGKTKKQVLRRIVKRLLLRAVLRIDDLSEGLDTTWGAIPAARRTIIRDKLRAVDVDTAIINGPDTMRIVQQKILDQNVPAFQVSVF